jgi:hypothetical protein
MDVKNINININLNSVKDFLTKLSKNLAWIFFGVFLLLVLFEIFEINSSVQIFINFNKNSTPPPVKDKSVRINFENYDAVVKRLENGNNFTPTGGVTKNPFTTQ